MIKIDWIATRFHVYAFAPGRGGERAKVKGKSKGFYYTQF
jgi:hypothetical protein